MTATEQNPCYQAHLRIVLTLAGHDAKYERSLAVTGIRGRLKVVKLGFPPLIQVQDVGERV
jgi:hypothetical protein